MCQTKRFVLLWMVVVFIAFFVMPWPGGDQTARAAKKIVMKIHNPWPPTHHLAVKVFEPWGKRLEQLSKGKIDAVFYHGGALGKASSVYDVVRGGGAEFGVWIPYIRPSEFPLTLVIHLPFSSPDNQVSTNVFNELIELIPELKQEYRHIHLYQTFGTDVYPLWTQKKKVVRPADLKGLKIRASGIQNKVVKKLGGSPVSLTGGQVYPAIERGILDGAIYSWTGAWGLKLPEISRYVTEIDVGLVAGTTIMNKKWWDKLPADIQALITGQGSYLNQLVQDSYTKGIIEVKEKIKSMGKPEFVKPSEAIMNEWKKVGISIWDEWADEMEAKGLPGRKVLSEFERLLNKYGVSVPAR